MKAESKKINEKNPGKKTAEEPKKLSKAGEWMRSGKSIGYIVDMKAVLK